MHDRTTHTLHTNHQSTAHRSLYFASNLHPTKCIVHCTLYLVLCQQSATPHCKGIVHGTLYIVSNLRPLSPMYFVYRTPSAHCYIAIYVHSYIVALLYRYIAMVRCTLDFACWNVDGGGGGYRSSGSYAGEAEHCKRDKTVLPVRT